MKTYKERTENVMQKIKQKKAQRRKRTLAVSLAGLVALTAVNLVLFTPYNTQPVELVKYQGSAYYSLMNKVNELTYTPPRYANNFEKWFGHINFNFLLAKDVAGGAAPEYDMMGSSNGSYQEVTSNQTQGVIEGDLFKRTDKYIFYMNNVAGDYDNYTNGAKVQGRDYVLQVYAIDKDNSQKVSEFTIKAEDKMRFNGYTDRAEMYLSQDGNQVTLLTPCYDVGKNVLYTAVINIDVSNVNNVKETGRKYVSGDYVSSRMTDDDLLLISNYSIRSNPDFEKPEQYLPQVGAKESLISIPAEDILLPKNASYANYTVVCKLDNTDLSVEDSMAFFSYSDEVYASESNLYVTHSYTQTTTEGDSYVNKSVTEISCVSYTGEGLALQGSVAVDGTVNDQYSLDEHNGVLRVFTSYSYRKYRSAVEGEYTWNRLEENHISASLYCIDLQSLEIIASVEKFAPQGETVRSARFDKEKAYVCTAIVVTDPVFAFDLSDLSNITYTDTGVIDGYSISLITFKDDTLLGIGYNEMMNLKVELYRETPTSLQSVSVYEPSEYVSFSQEFKAYYLDTVNGYVGLQDDYNGKYILLHFDGYNLVETIKTPFDSDRNSTRAVMIDGWLYLLGERGIKAVSVF